MKASGLAMLGILLTPVAAAAEKSSPPDAGSSPSDDSRLAAGRSHPAANLIAFVGKKIEARYVEPKPQKPGIWLFDAEYFLRYKVLEVVYGTYSAKEIAFSSYIHTGEPAFKKYKFGLVYVSEYDGRLVQQKYLFQGVYPTADGRWASCGDPYADWPNTKGPIKPEPVDFRPAVVFDTRRISEAEIEKRFPAPLFRLERGKAICLMGNYPAELFQVMRNGPLLGRRVFPPPPRQSPEPSNKPLQQSGSPQ
jgi:hypothetical protein